MNNFTFNDANGKHEYKLNGRKIPSVTTVISTVLNIDYSFLDPWYRDFGTAVHKAIELDVMDGLDEHSVMPEALICLLAFREFVEKVNLRSIVPETRLYNEKLMVAGTMDIIADLQGEKYIIDLKTAGNKSTKKSGWHKIQTAGYSLLLDKDQKNPPKRGALYLFREGGYEFIPHPDVRDTHMFDSMVKVYHSLGRYK